MYRNYQATDKLPQQICHPVLTYLGQNRQTMISKTLEHTGECFVPTKKP